MGWGGVGWGGEAGGIPEGDVAELESGGALPRGQRLYARGRRIRANRRGLTMVKG